MSAKPEVVIPNALLADISQAERKSPALMATAFQRDQRFLQSAFLKLVAANPGAHKRPTKFQSKKQQGWWFAVGRKSWKGRTGKQQKGWRTDTRTSNTGGVFRCWNTNPASVYIQGNRQQQMHFGTWKREEDAVREFQPLAESRIRETARTVFDPTAGVKR